MGMTPVNPSCARPLQELKYIITFSILVLIIVEISSIN